jgi:hypothetical protein
MVEDLNADRLHGLLSLEMNSRSGTHPLVSHINKMQSNKRFARSAAMQEMVKKRQITPDGADWLTLRLDPYHDFTRPIAGYPDADTVDTIVSVRNYEYNVSKPAGALANWDAHIFTLPFDGAPFKLGTCTNGIYVESASTFDLGLVNIAKDDTGAPLWYTANPVVSANYSCVPVSDFSGVQDGLSRVIGMGLEIIDTTAAIYQQGALTAYRMPACNNTRTQIDYTDSTAVATGPLFVDLVSSPPSTVGEAVLYRTSTQWAAPEGAYMVVGQQGVENPFTLATKRSYIVANSTTMIGAGVACVTPAWWAVANAPPAVSSLAALPVVKPLNICQQGVFLSGLHNSATFKVRVRVYIERAPLHADTALIPLASPSAIYDYKALCLYSLLSSHLPACVPVGQNAKGDWWRTILDTIMKVVPVLYPSTAPIVGAIDVFRRNYNNQNNAKKAIEAAPKQNLAARARRQGVSSS